jgi:hypothetical protein
MTTRASGRLLPAAGLMLMLPLALGQPSHAEDRPPSTPAQIALFETNQLEAIHQPVELDYQFRHESAGTASFADKVKIEIKSVRADGRKDIAVDFLSGERHVAFPGIADFSGNPLLMYFLEFDVQNMQRDTGGSALFFRNRIRDAFADGSAEMRPTKIGVNGSQVDATEIVIHPYAKITRPEMTRFTGKSYAFVLSNAVAGTIYQIRSELPKSDQAPAITESLTFAGEQP